MACSFRPHVPQAVDVVLAINRKLAGQDASPASDRTGSQPANASMMEEHGNESVGGDRQVMGDGDGTRRGARAYCRVLVPRRVYPHAGVRGRISYSINSRGQLDKHRGCGNPMLDARRFPEELELRFERR